MDVNEFVGSIATNVAADWTQALIAPVGIFGWKACCSAWNRRPTNPVSVLSQAWTITKGLRNPKNWIATALFPMVFLPYSIASLIWFSPLLVLGAGPMTHALRDTDGKLPSWMAVAFIMLSMTPVCLITYNRLFNRDKPLREALNLYIDGIAIWLLVIVAMALVAVLAMPIKAIVSIFDDGNQGNAHQLVSMGFIGGAIVISAGIYWVGCLCVAQGRLFPELMSLIRMMGGNRTAARLPGSSDQNEGLDRASGSDLPLNTALSHPRSPIYPHE